MQTATQPRDGGNFLWRFFNFFIEYFSSLLFKLFRLMFFRFFSKAKNWGCIVVKFADENQVHYFGDVKSERKVQLTIKNPRAFLWRGFHFKTALICLLHFNWHFLFFFVSKYSGDIGRCGICGSFHGR